VEYGTEAVPDSVRVVNPAWRQLDSQVRTLTGKRQRLLVQFAAQGLQGELSESEVTRYQQKKAQLQEEIEHLGKQLDQIKLQRKQTAHHVTVGELPEAERFSRLLSERKHFLDTIKLISYRAETSMASLLRDSMSRGDDTRALLRQIYSTEADLLPDADNKTLTVRLHHLTQAAHDQALLGLCDELNATETIFPGTDLRLIYKLGSC
jgi:chromosome segregation ATPase